MSRSLLLGCDVVIRVTKKAHCVMNFNVFSHAHYESLWLFDNMWTAHCVLWVSSPAGRLPTKMEREKIGRCVKILANYPKAQRSRSCDIQWAEHNCIYRGAQASLYYTALTLLSGCQHFKHSLAIILWSHINSSMQKKPNISSNKLRCRCMHVQNGHWVFLPRQINQVLL